MNIDKIALGKRIKTIRVQEQDTLEAFSNKINKASGNVIKSGKSNVSRWEKGENIPNDITLKAIADIAGITVDYLLYGDNDINIELKEFLEERRLKYTSNKINRFKKEANLLLPSVLSGALTFGLGFKNMRKKAVEDYEKSSENIEELNKFGKKYIEENYETYTYKQFILEFPNASAKDFQQYKEDKWNILSEILDDYWNILISFSSLSIESLINHRFTNQIRNSILEVFEVSEDSEKVTLYVNEELQPILDEAAQKIKNRNLRKDSEV